MFKRSLISLSVSSILMTSVAFSQTPAWVEDNSENAEGIITQNPQENAPVTINLSKVIVTGALKEELAIAESAATIAHFGVQEVDRLNATSLADLLDYEPGVTVDRSRTGGLGDVRIRGMGENRVMIAVDGAPLPNSFSFGPYVSMNRAYFDIDAMKSIDIIKGPMSTLYGGSALSGGIFMQTKDPSDFIKSGQNIGGEAKIGYRTATRETLLSGTIAGHLTDKISAFGRLTYTNPDARENHQGRASKNQTVGPHRTAPNPSDSDTYNILTKWVFNPNSDNRLSLTYEDFKDKTNSTPYSEIGTITSSYKQLSFHNKDKNRRQQFALRHDFDFQTALFDRGFWHLYYQKNKAEQWTYEQRLMIKNNSTIERDRYNTFENKGYGFGAEFSKGIAQSDKVYHNLTYGLNFRENKVSTSRYGDTRQLSDHSSIETEPFPNKSFPDSTIRELGIFVQDRISLFEGQFEVIAGLRYDHYKLSPKSGSAFESANAGVLPPSGMSESQFSKRLALLWHPTEANTIFFNYSEGFRAPTYSAVNMGFSNPAHGYTSRSNPNLKPEKSQSYELGWNYIDDARSFALTGFYVDYKNFIEEQALAGIDPDTHMMIFQARNLDKSRIYGFEAKAHMDLFTIQNGNGVIGINASLAYAKGEERKTKNPINSVEPLTAVVGVDYSYLDQLYLSARVKAVQAKKESDISQATDPRSPKIPRSPGYATLDLIAEYKPQRDITINAGLYNVFDKQYWSWSEWKAASSASARERASNPGFNAAFSIKYEF